MLGALLHIRGHWGQFRKPETNNTPLSHDFITKTAFIGMIGAVLGIDREEMRPLFPVLCEDLLYGVQVRTVVKKVSWAFTLRNVHKLNDASEQGPRQMEFVREPDYTVVLALRNTRSESTYHKMVAAVQNHEAYYTPVLGLHNCPAELASVDEMDFEQGDGDYVTKGFALRSQHIHLDDGITLNFERIPTFQDNNWWNHPDRYREVIYPSAGSSVRMTGKHYVTRDGGAWCLI